MWWETHLLAWIPPLLHLDWRKQIPASTQLFYSSKNRCGLIHPIEFAVSSSLTYNSSSMNGEKSQMPPSIKWYHGIFTKDMLQYTVPGHFDAELALNIIHFSQQPLPNVSQLVTSTASKTNLKHYSIRTHINRLHPQGLLPLWVVSQSQHFQTKIL